MTTYKCGNHCCHYGEEPPAAIQLDRVTVGVKASDVGAWKMESTVEPGSSQKYRSA